MEELNDDALARQRLDELREQAGELIEPCLYKSSFALYGDLRARAKQEQELYHYVTGTFFQMDQAQYLLDFQTTRERSIELISLLESEEQARKIQADFPMPVFEALVYQMSSCAYENLAEATGQLDGYNSEGMQACITDGLQICRQTGKLPCVGCFREYSCDVYMAADDAEIANHQCSLVLEQTSFSDRGDRRWLAKKKMAWMCLLDGRIDEAIVMLRDALKLSEHEEVGVKTEARLKVLYDLDAALILSGQDAAMKDDPVFARHPSADECPMFDLSGALNLALSETVRKNYSSAAEILVKWDRLLQERKATHLWFDVRLRLVAVKLLNGDDQQAQRLAKQLEQRASDASDWLTLRRLTALQDPDFPTSPLALFGQPTAMPMTVSAGPSGEATEAVAKEPEEEDTPLKATLEALGSRIPEIREGFEAEDLDAICGDLMDIDFDTVTHRHDACMMMHIMSFTMSDNSKYESIWHWANSLASKFETDGTAVSLLASIGDRIRVQDAEGFGKTITVDRLEPLFRKSMQMDGTRPRTFMRAGDHFAIETNYGEAERCYARAFRLCRDAGDIALRLAKLYQNTERPRDAMHVLDVCLREGCEDPEVAWEASLTAFLIERYEAMLTYLDQFESAIGTVPWVDYYRSIGLLEQGDSAGALEAIQRETAHTESGAFHILVVRGVCHAHAGKKEQAQSDLHAAIDIGLATVDYLSPTGISSLLNRARVCAQDVLDDSELLARIDQRLLQAGLAPEEAFEAERLSNPETSVTLYRCLVVQTLDDKWNDFEGRLLGQEDWDAYLAEWGVIAPDEEAAQEIALAWQNRCYSIPAEIEVVAPSEDTFHDSPGVVWQGMRFPPGNADDEMAEE